MHRLLPSNNVRDPWLFLESRDEIFESSDISGKWCIFRTTDVVDDAWRAVVQLWKAGRILHAKVSTVQAVAFGGYDRHVICVYTRDWQDQEDVQRMRDLLREAGFTERLGYKRDSDTAAGVERFVYES